MAASTNGNHTILHGWIWSRNSNVSVVKEGGLFVEGSYVPFQSAVHKHLEFTEKRRVAGVGTVCIPISMPSAEGDHRHLVMYVEEVLHVPTASYNILCHEDLMKSYEVLQPSHSSADPATIIDRRNNIGIATFDTPNPLLCPRFKLSGSPILLPLGDLDFTSAKWTDKERQYYSLGFFILGHMC